MTELFIADIHLDRGNSERQRLFVRFCDEAAARASRLYILGDLFNYWIGPRHLGRDDYRDAIDALARLSARGCDVQYVIGNRDIHVRSELARATGITIHRRGVRHQRGQQREFYCHGDGLCTSDGTHQIVKNTLGSGPFVALYTRLAENTKVQMAEGYTAFSGRLKRQAKAHAHRIQPGALHKLFRQGVETIVCGHIHRECHRTFEGPGGARHNLYCLGHWLDTAPYLAWDEEGYRFGVFG